MTPGRRGGAVAVAVGAALLAGSALVGLARCGGGAVCGNGVQEEGEQCDYGDRNGQPGVPCSAQCQSIHVDIAQINLNWTLLRNGAVPGYSGATCSDVGAVFARVHLEGPSSGDETIDCSNRGKMFAQVCEPPPAGMKPDAMARPKCKLLVAGSYTLTVTLLADDKTPVSRPVTTEKVDVQPGGAVPLIVDFGMKDFLKQDYQGTLYFHASWGDAGVECRDVPAVTGELLTLVRDGDAKPVAGKTTVKGTKLDGSAPGKCFSADGAVDLHEQVDGLLWGRYMLGVKSQDGAYATTAPVFVGPGKYGPTYQLTVPKL